MEYKDYNTTKECSECGAVGCYLMGDEYFCFNCIVGLTDYDEEDNDQHSFSIR